MKYRKKPVVIEAFQWKVSMGEIGDVFFQENDPDVHKYEFKGMTGNWKINTLEGCMRVTPEDWIITGINGEKYPCKPDIFEKTYEQA